MARCCHQQASTKTLKIMFKSGDDLRQDQLIMQMLMLMDKVLQQGNMDLGLTTFKVLATSAQSGILEFVEDSFPVSEVLQAHDNSILSFFRKHRPAPQAVLGVDPECLDAYIKSTAGYCVLTHLLGIGDRHLDNVMLKTSGHLFHLDFGFVFAHDPKPYPPPFKLTREMVEGMGGMESVHYSRFKVYCCQVRAPHISCLRLFISSDPLLSPLLLPPDRRRTTGCATPPR